MSAAKLPGTCDYCGHFHQGVCPMVKAIEYFEDGTIRRVEFKTAADYSQQVTAIPHIGPNTALSVSSTAIKDKGE